MKKIIIFIVFLSQIGWANSITVTNNIEGKGQQILNHSKIKVHYIGKLKDGTIFDNSYKRGQPFSFQIGLKQVIEGWEQGLLGMKVGGKRTLMIPPKLAYGDRGAGDLIPPNSTLIFEIEIVDAIPPNYINISSKELEKKQKEGLIIIDIRNIGIFGVRSNVLQLECK